MVNTSVHHAAASGARKSRSEGSGSRHKRHSSPSGAEAGDRWRPHSIKTRDAALKTGATVRQLHCWRDQHLFAPPMVRHAYRWSEADVTLITVIREARRKEIPFETLRAILRPLRRAIADESRPLYLLIDRRARTLIATDSAADVLARFKRYASLDLIELF
jgi:DNA-binding transcriptional MerR regulator